MSFEILVEATKTQADLIEQTQGDPSALRALAALFEAQSKAPKAKAEIMLKGQLANAEPALTDGLTTSACGDALASLSQLLTTIGAKKPLIATLEKTKSVLLAYPNVSIESATQGMEAAIAATAVEAEAKRRAKEDAKRASAERVRRRAEAFRSVRPTRANLEAALDAMRAHKPALSAAEWKAVAHDLAGLRVESKTKAETAIRNWIRFASSWEHARDSVKEALAEGY